MKKASLIVIAALVLAVALPTFAGEKHKKCTTDAEECLKNMKAKIANKAWLGIEMDTTKDGYHKITKVVEGSPAEAAGFAAGDVLLAMNGVSYAKDNGKEIKAAWGEVSPGSAAKFIVKRDGEKMKIKAELAHVPNDMAKKWVHEHMEKYHADTKMAKK